MIFWLYGRSGAGKTTLANRLEAGLRARQMHAFLLDGDELRSGLCSDLGFGEDARDENHRRAAEMAKLIAKRDIVVIAATMAPQHAQRDIINDTLGDSHRWVFVDASYEVCAERDPKGLYKKAAEGKLTRFKDFPFDSPRSAEVNLHLSTIESSEDECYQWLLEFVLGELSDHAI